MKEDRPGQEIVPRKYGEGTEWTFGEHYRLTIDQPMKHVVQRRIESNEYIDATEVEPNIRIEKTQLHRARLDDLFPYIARALDNGHDFTVDYMADGRSDPRGYVSLHQSDAMEFYRFLWRSITKTVQ